MLPSLTACYICTDHGGHPRGKPEETGKFESGREESGKCGKSEKMCLISSHRPGKSGN